jgi:hypothetical protein
MTRKQLPRRLTSSLVPLNIALVVPIGIKRERGAWEKTRAMPRLPRNCKR